MNSEQSQLHDDEINLGDLIRHLWAGKWLVIGITFITTILAIIYLVITPVNYNGTLEISPLSTVKKMNYQQLAESRLLNVNANDLELLFIEDIQNLMGLEQAIKQNGYLIKLENESDLEFSTHVRETALGFVVSKKINKKDNISQNKSQIKFKTQQPDLVLKVLADALEISNSNVNQQVQNTINFAIEKHTRRLTKELEEIDFDSVSLIKNAKLKTQYRIAFLKEQATLARSIELDKNTFNEITFSDQSALVDSVNKEERFYLRGYIIIEQEIESLLKRQSELLFIPEIVKNQKRQHVLEQNQDIKILKGLMRLTTLGTDKFEAVSYDIISTTFENKIKPSLIFALAIILGGIMGVIVLLVRNTLIRQD